jgi:hypothetical protein
MKVDAIIKRLEKDGWKVKSCIGWRGCEYTRTGVIAEKHRGLTRVLAASYHALYRKVYGRI